MDVLLLVSFGGPEGPDDVVPFLENVTRGRGIPRERLVEVGAHYAQFAGVSPINALNRALVADLRAELDRRGIAMPVLWGNRNWDPLLPEALAAARDLGATRVIAVLTSAFSSYSGCRQYRENLADALGSVQAEDPGWRPEVVKVRAYFNTPGFVDPLVRGTAQALDRLPAGSRLVFTTHSIPTADAQRCDYLAQHRDCAATIAARLGLEGQWDLVFQSRSGAPQVPWLEPDIGAHLADLAARGVPGAAVVPLGFVSDHMEVVWDLDTVARQVAAEVGIAFERVATPGSDPRFVATLVDLVAERLAATTATGTPEGATALGWLGPRPAVCASGCCPNPRGPRPALCGVQP